MAISYYCQVVRQILLEMRVDLQELSRESRKLHVSLLPPTVVAGVDGGRHDDFINDLLPYLSFDNLTYLLMHCALLDVLRRIHEAFGRKIPARRALPEKCHTAYDAKAMEDFNSWERNSLNGSEVAIPDRNQIRMELSRLSGEDKMKHVDSALAQIMNYIDTTVVFHRGHSMVAELLDFAATILDQSSDPALATSFFNSRLVLVFDMQCYYNKGGRALPEKDKDGSKHLQAAYEECKRYRPNILVGNLLAIDIYHQAWRVEFAETNKEKENLLLEALENIRKGFFILDKSSTAIGYKNTWKRIMICKACFALLGISNGMYMIPNFEPSEFFLKQAQSLLVHFREYLMAGNDSISQRVMLLYLICQARCHELMGLPGKAWTDAKDSLFYDRSFRFKESEYLYTYVNNLADKCSAAGINVGGYVSQNLDASGQRSRSGTVEPCDFMDPDETAMKERFKREDPLEACSQALGTSTAEVSCRADSTEEWSGFMFGDGSTNDYNSAPCTELQALTWRRNSMDSEYLFSSGEVETK